MLVRCMTDVRLAFLLLSRLPQPTLPNEAFEHGARAVWAYPLVGAVVGGLAALAGIAGMTLGLPPALAAGLVLLVMITTTGALHEDGLADVADGFWGGHTVDRRLEIMKDSQIGTFGTLALIVSCGWRWMALAALLPLAPAVVVISAATSRATMPLLMHGLPHARTTGLSHSVGCPEISPVLLGLGLVLVINLSLIGTLGVLPVALAVLVAALMKALARRKINGQTGDVLGASQQVSESVILGVLLIVLP